MVPKEASGGNNMPVLGSVCVFDFLCTMTGLDLGGMVVNERSHDPKLAGWKLKCTPP